jgi:hypothetical protein
VFFFPYLGGGARTPWPPPEPWTKQETKYLLIATVILVAIAWPFDGPMAILFGLGATAITRLQHAIYSWWYWNFEAKRQGN